jgi:hypothetical protein
VSKIFQELNQYYHEVEVCPWEYILLEVIEESGAKVLSFMMEFRGGKR